MLVELKIKSTKSFYVLEILVKLPFAYIDSHLKPFFGPPLQNEVKKYGKKWRDSLSNIRDPAHNFAYVSKTRIAPRRATEFVKTLFSSDSIANRTRIFVIGEGDWSEKTGNVSFFVEISAFNQNYSVYESMSHHSRNHDWRWRVSEHRFNLTILLDYEYELRRRKSRIVCFNSLRRTLSARENCGVMLSKNITIDHLGKMTLLLGDYFSFPDNFQKLINERDIGLWSIFKISFSHNPFHKLNYTIEMVSIETSKIIGI